MERERLGGDRDRISYADCINPKEAVILRKNKSCFFILPLLGYPSYWYYGLINCYLGDETNKPEFSLDKIFVRVKSYDNKLTGLPYFNQFYRLEDNTYMFVYNIPPQHEIDYINFYKGKYSEMSTSAKTLICKLSGVKPIQDSTVYKVLYKTNDQRQKIEELIGQKLPDSAELYSVPNMDTEIYKELLISSVSKLEREGEIECQ